ncbi:hypothetical protein HDU82_002486 [Entophlyctis luteolus]|nr:hypothetical protein HDU82_002486 [Entophlyctis luteolus]
MDSHMQPGETIVYEWDPVYHRQFESVSDSSSTGSERGGYGPEDDAAAAFAANHPLPPDVDGSYGFSLPRTGIQTSPPLATLRRLQREAEQLEVYLRRSLEAASTAAAAAAREQQVQLYRGRGGVADAVSDDPVTAKAEYETMLAHLASVHADLASVQPLIEAAALKPPVGDEILQRARLSMHGPRLINRIKAFAQPPPGHVRPFKLGRTVSSTPPATPIPIVSGDQKGAAFAQVEPLAHEPAVPVVNHVSTFNILCSRFDDDEFSPDLNALSARISALEALIGTSVQDPLPATKYSSPRLDSSRLLLTNATSPTIQPAAIASRQHLKRATTVKAHSIAIEGSIIESILHLDALISQLYVEVPDVLDSRLDSPINTLSDLAATQIELAETSQALQRLRNSAWQVVGAKSSKKNRVKRQQAALLAPIDAAAANPAFVRTVDLHAKVAAVDKPLDRLPAVVQRLDTLRPVHLRASLLGDAVAQVRASHERNLEGLDALEALATVVDKSLEENLDIVQRNMDAFDWRIMKLLMRIKGARVVRVESPQQFDDE